MIGAQELTGLATIMSVALAGLFAVAATSKIRRSTTGEMRALDLPFPRVLAVLVPAVELGTAAALVAVPRLGAVVTVALLVAFTAVLVRTILSGRRVDCGCLGSVSDGPVGWTSVFRNGVLIVMAIVVVVWSADGASAGGEASPGGQLTIPDLAAALTFVGFVAVAAMSGQLLATWQQLGRLWSVQLAGEAFREDQRRSS